MRSELIKYELAKNPSYQDSDKGSKGYPECPPSPFRGLSLFSSYWRNAVDKPSPLFAGVWGNNGIANFISRFARHIEARKFVFITNKVNIVSPNTNLVLLLQNHTTRRYPIIPVCFLAKESTTNTSMFRQFHNLIITREVTYE